MEPELTLRPVNERDRHGKHNKINAVSLIVKSQIFVDIQNRNSTSEFFCLLDSRMLENVVVRIGYLQEHTFLFFNIRAPS